MTVEEFRSWVSYRNKRGSLNSGFRTDGAVALALAQIFNSKLKPGAVPFKVSDFMPYADAEPKDEAPISLDQAMKEW